MTAASPFTDVVVAIHGIGSQQRSATVRSVAVRLAMSDSLSANALELPVAPQPLGYFHSDVQSMAAVRLVDDSANLGPAALAGVGFSEVYWADIPQRAVDERRTLEETKAWARTVIARARAHCLRAAKKNPGEIVPPDFNLAAEVLDEIVDTVDVLENLTFLADKAGLFKLDLRQVLDDYLGDVQLVAEFGNYRSEIVGRFFEAMASIHQQHPQARLHVVAHSEGTVVSFLGLLQAMSGLGPDGRAAAAAPAWLSQVRGYMTIGSPIDKHLLLWPRLWRELEPKRANRLFERERIQWRNYYDYGDPVGFKLETARAWLAWKDVQAFAFTPENDIGFARYPLPGKAHNDYWDDSDVFEHFVTEVVNRVPGGGSKPHSKPEVAIFSPLLPYGVSLALVSVASYVLYKAVTQFLFPQPGPIEESMLVAQGVRTLTAVSGLELLRNVFGVTMLIVGTTLFARLPRLAAGGGWKLLGFASFLAGAGLYATVVTADSRHAIGQFFDLAWLRALAPNHPTLGPTVGVCLVALVVALVGLAGARKVRKRNDDRRQRWFWRGMRPLIFCGALGVAVIVGWQMLFPAPIPPDVPASAVPLYRPQQPVWPVVLATGGFLYLWWLSALIFDLGFVWHRYVRRSVAIDRLAEWKPYDFDAPPSPVPPPSRGAATVE